MRRDHRLADDALVQIGMLAQNREAFLLQFLAPNTIECSGVGNAGFDGLRLNVLIAEHLQQNIVALRIEAEMLEPEQHAHPGGATDASQADFLATQVFRAFDVWSRDKIVGVAAGKSSDDLEIMTGADRGQGRAAAAPTELNVAGCEARD